MAQDRVQSSATELPWTRRDGVQIHRDDHPGAVRRDHRLLKERDCARAIQGAERVRDRSWAVAQFLQSLLWGGSQLLGRLCPVRSLRGEA